MQKQTTTQPQETNDSPDTPQEKTCLTCSIFDADICRECNAKSCTYAKYPLWQSGGISNKPLHGNSHKLKQEVIFSEEDEFTERFYK